jgi:hypothetical protein
MKFSFILFGINLTLSSIVGEENESPQAIGPKDIAGRSIRKIRRIGRRIDGYHAASLPKLEPGGWNAAFSCPKDMAGERKGSRCLMKSRRSFLVR